MPMAVVPGVAEKWEQKDATTWIFHLRKNAKWSNGEPVVANDFVYGCSVLSTRRLLRRMHTFGIFLLNGAEIVAGKKSPDTLGRARNRPVHGRDQTPYPVRSSRNDVEYEISVRSTGRRR